ncbi:hypothetical protein Hanom_Chr11g00995291 [Helianthus anomalus]
MNMRVCVYMCERERWRKRKRERGRCFGTLQSCPILKCTLHLSLFSFISLLLILFILVSELSVLPLFLTGNYT